jgi:hypothetical protein
MNNIIDTIFNFNWPFIGFLTIISICFFFFLRYVKSLLIFFLKNIEEEYKDYKKRKLLYFSKMFFKGTIIHTASSLLFLVAYFADKDEPQYIEYLLVYIIFMYLYCFTITYSFVSKKAEKKPNRQPLF